MTLERAQWLGYRWNQHGLGGGGNELEALLTLGFQDSRQRGQLQALSQRTDAVAGKTIHEAITPTGPLVSCWSLRGAPHAHHASTLDLLASALAPRTTDEGGAAYVDAVQTVAAAIKETVTRRMTKAELSAQVASMVPASLVHHCARCKADHVDDGVFRVAGMQAQIVIGPMDGRAMTVCPRPNVRQRSAKGSAKTLLTTLFTVNGPQSKKSVEQWLGTGPATTSALWKLVEDGLSEVRLDGKRMYAPNEILTAMQSAAEPHGVVILPPNDPYLRQVDRTLLIPDKEQRQQIFTSLSSPGALVVDGEVSGSWRYRKQDGIIIQPFRQLSPRLKEAAQEAAERLTDVMGVPLASVSWR